MAEFSIIFMIFILYRQLILKKLYWLKSNTLGPQTLIASSNREIRKERIIFQQDLM